MYMIAERNWCLFAIGVVIRLNVTAIKKKNLDIFSQRNTNIIGLVVF